VTSAAFALIAVTMLPHGTKTSREQSQWSIALKDMWANKAFIVFFFANLLAIGTFFQWGSGVARLIVDLGYSKSVYGWLIAGNGLPIALLEFPLSQLTRRRSARHVIALGFLLCGVGVWVTGFAAGGIVIAIALVIFTFGEMISMPVSGAYVASLSPEEMRGALSEAVGLTWNLGHAR